MNDHGPAGARGTAQATVTIDRPRPEVFAFYRDFTNLPRFLGDVAAVEPTSPGRSRWTILGPLGTRLHWTVEVTEERTDELISYETRSLPAVRGRWDVRFSPADTPDGTVVHEVITLPLGRWTRTALAALGKPPAAEVAANLHRLKQLLETGEITDTSHSVPGRFHRPAP